MKIILKKQQILMQEMQKLKKNTRKMKRKAKKKTCIQLDFSPHCERTGFTYLFVIIIILFSKPNNKCKTKGKRVRDETPNS